MNAGRVNPRKIKILINLQNRGIGDIIADDHDKRSFTPWQNTVPSAPLEFTKRNAERPVQNTGLGYTIAFLGCCFSFLFLFTSWFGQRRVGIRCCRTRAVDESDCTGAEER